MAVKLKNSHDFVISSLCLIKKKLLFQLFFHLDETNFYVAQSSAEFMHLFVLLAPTASGSNGNPGQGTPTVSLDLFVLLN